MRSVDHLGPSIMASMCMFVCVFVFFLSFLCFAEDGSTVGSTGAPAYRSGSDPSTSSTQVPSSSYFCSRQDREGWASIFARRTRASYSIRIGIPTRIARWGEEVKERARNFVRSALRGSMIRTGSMPRCLSCTWVVLRPFFPFCSLVALLSIDACALGPAAMGLVLSFALLVCIY